MISAWLGSWFGQLALLIHKTSSPGKLLSSVKVFTNTLNRASRIMISFPDDLVLKISARSFF